MATNTDTPKPHVLHPKGEHRYTIILLHGRGSSGAEFAEEFLTGETSTAKTIPQKVDNKACRWVFPTACNQRWSPFVKEPMLEWFDIQSLTNPEAGSASQIAGLRKSLHQVNDIIDEELRSVPASSILLGGISQGYAVGIHVLLTRKETFGGFVGVSGWMPFRSKVHYNVDPTAESLTRFYKDTFDIQAHTSAETLKTPVFLSHSSDDFTVQMGHGDKACETLKRFGMNVVYHRYVDGGHWLQEPLGYDDLLAFLQSWQGRAWLH